MIKKYKNFIIELTSIQIKLDDILRIINIIKKNKLGVVKIYNGKNKEIINLKKIDKEIIYELIVDVSAKNRKNDFKICFFRKGSYIQYYNEIDSDKLLILIKLEEIIREKRVLILPRKVSSKIRFIFSLVTIIFVSINPIIKLINIKEQLLNVFLAIFFFIFTCIYFLDYDDNTMIIIHIKNKFKRFYYKYYSINNLLRVIISSSILFFLLFIFNYFSNKFWN